MTVFQAASVMNLIQATFTNVLIHFLSCPVLCCQLAQAWQEVEVAKSRSQQLQDQVEDLQEKLSLQEDRSYGDVSLLSELEISLGAADVGVSKEEVSRSLLGDSVTHDRLEAVCTGGVFCLHACHVLYAFNLEPISCPSAADAN